MPLRRTALAIGLALAAVASLGLWLGSGDGGETSSHREAPLISQDPTADTTDLYAFVSPDAPDTVTFAGNWIPLELAPAGPNFYGFGDDVRYEFNIDNNGDAVADVTYRFEFTTTVADGSTFLYNTGPVTSISDETLNVRQTYTVTRVDAAGESVVASDLVAAPYNVGQASMPDYGALVDEALHELPGGGQVFAGPRDDPFFAALGPIFDLLQVQPAVEDAGYQDYLAGVNVHSIVLQLPHTAVTSDGAPATDPAGANAIIGVCATSHRQATILRNPDGTRSGDGAFVQVSRLCHPLVNEVIVPLAAKDLFNASRPADDAQFLAGVQDPIPGRLIPAIYGVDVPPAPRDDLVTIFLTGIPDLNQPANVVPSEQLRLNLAVPPSDDPDPLGVLAGDNAGFPNGRRLTDDVVDISLRAVAGATPFTPDFNVAPNNALADGVDANDKEFSASFPYLADPTPYDALVGSVRMPEPGGAGDMAGMPGDGSMTDAQVAEVEAGSDGDSWWIALVAAGLAVAGIGSGIAFVAMRRRAERTY
jgi:Domain of unknown function (DUF4331)